MNLFKLYYLGIYCISTFVYFPNFAAMLQIVAIGYGCKQNVEADLFIVSIG